MADRRVTVLAGGVGGARFLQGLLQVVDPETVTIVGNVGDDLEPFGLHVSPDLDTVLYTLTGRIDAEKGWGVRGDTPRALEQARALGAEAWFWLGDLDLGLHMARTEMLRAGLPLSAATARLADAMGLRAALVPATDDRLRTMITTPNGEIDFQTYYVRRAHADPVLGVRFDGADAARPAPGVLAAIAAAEVVIIAPSNPFISIDPILSVPGIRAAVSARRDRVVAVSPIVAGKALRGPAAGMLETLGHEMSVVGVAEVYRSLASTLVIDDEDAQSAERVERLGLRARVTATVMANLDASRALAAQTLAAGGLAP
ncbi:MAG TPA: 2-phospho-L-lactate transferase [Gaiellales bacterium]